MARKEVVSYLVWFTLSATLKERGREGTPLATAPPSTRQCPFDSKLLFPPIFLTTVEPDQAYPLRFYQWIDYFKFESVRQFQECIHFKYARIINWIKIWFLITDRRPIWSKEKARIEYFLIINTREDSDLSVGTWSYLSKALIVYKRPLILLKINTRLKTTNGFKFQVIDSLTECKGVHSTRIDCKYRADCLEQYS